MMEGAKTVGELIQLLGKYDFNTPIVTGCGECLHGYTGGIVKVEDRTNQTYGYIELNVNLTGHALKMSRQDMEFKCYQMAHFTDQRLGSIYKYSDYDLKELYHQLWRDLEVESVRI